jgi:hypothetical protein
MRRFLFACVMVSPLCPNIYWCFHSNKLNQVSFNSSYIKETFTYVIYTIEG